MNILLGIWLAAHSCDAITTHVALSRGGVERNPLMTQSAHVNDVIFASEAAATGALMKKYAPRHPKSATALALAGIALSSYAAIHNMHTIQVQR